MVRKGVTEEIPPEYFQRIRRSSSGGLDGRKGFLDGRNSNCKVTK